MDGRNVRLELNCVSGAGTGQCGLKPGSSQRVSPPAYLMPKAISSTANLDGISRRSRPIRSRSYCSPRVHFLRLVLLAEIYTMWTRDFYYGDGAVAISAVIGDAI